MEEYAFDMVNLASVGFSAPLYAYKQQTQIEQLQKLAAKCIEKNWDSLKEHERTFLTKGFVAHKSFHRLKRSFSKSRDGL